MERHEEWVRVERTSAFRELTQKRKAFIIPATIFFLVFYFGLPFLTAFTTVLDVNVIGAINLAYDLRLRAVRDDLDPHAPLRQPGQRVGRSGGPGQARGRGGDEASRAGGTGGRSERPGNIHHLLRLDHRADARHHRLGVAPEQVDTSHHYVAGGEIKGWQNGLAISGDYLSAASFLGIAGAISLTGFSGFYLSIGFLVAYLVVLLLVAEPLRNLGKYTFADMLASRFNTAERALGGGALSTIAISMFYMIAQLNGAGALIELLLGLPYSLSVIVIGILMTVYIVAGGMVATTWIQIVKAVLLIAGTLTLSLLVLAQPSIGFNPVDLFNEVELADRPRDGGAAAAGRARRRARRDLAQHRPRARDGGAAAHPDPVPHRPRRQDGPVLDRHGDLDHRPVLPADTCPGLRRGALRRPGRHRGAEPGGQPGRSAARRGARRSRSSSPSSRRSPSPPSWPWSPGSSSRPPAPSPTTSTRT